MTIMNLKTRPTKEKLQKLYKELSVMDACKELGITPVTLYRWLAEFGVKRKGHPYTIASWEEKKIFLQKFQKEHGWPPSANEIALNLKIAPQTAKTWLIKMAIAGEVEKGDFYYPRQTNIYRSYKINERKPKG